VEARPGQPVQPPRYKSRDRSCLHARIHRRLRSVHREVPTPADQKHPRWRFLP
jgi:hypothetical protein